MNAPLATSRWQLGGKTLPKVGSLGDTLSTDIRQGLAGISAAGKQTRELTEVASDTTVRIVGLSVDATGDKEIVINLIVARSGLTTRRKFSVMTLSSPLLVQLVHKAANDGAQLVVEPASMLVHLGLLATAQTPLADEVLYRHLKVLRQEGGSGHQPFRE